MPFDGRGFEQKKAEVLDMLRQSREMIARPGGWCQHNLALGSSACAVGWPCSLGGASPKYIGPAVLELFGAIPDEWRAMDKAGHDWWKTVVRYNDAHGRTQAEIVALYDRAIAQMEQTEGTRQ